MCPTNPSPIIASVVGNVIVFSEYVRACVQDVNSNEMFRVIRAEFLTS